MSSWAIWLDQQSRISKKSWIWFYGWLSWNARSSSPLDTECTFISAINGFQTTTKWNNKFEWHHARAKQNKKLLSGQNGPIHESHLALSIRHKEFGLRNVSDRLNDQFLVIQIARCPLEYTFFQFLGNIKLAPCFLVERSRQVGWRAHGQYQSGHWVLSHLRRDLQFRWFYGDSFRLFFRISAIEQKIVTLIEYAHGFEAQILTVLGCFDGRLSISDRAESCIWHFGNFSHGRWPAWRLGYNFCSRRLPSVGKMPHVRGEVCFGHTVERYRGEFCTASRATETRYSVRLIGRCLLAS